MIALGINCAYHESAACIVVDGEVITAVEEERFTRIKHGKPAEVGNGDQIPTNAIEHCLRAAGVEPAAVDEIGVSINPKRRLRNQEFQDRVLEGDWGSGAGEQRFYETLLRVPGRLEELGFRAKFNWLDHHLCHAASAFLTSPFEEAAVMAIDGIGEDSSTDFRLGRGSSLKFLASIQYPASIGFLWERFCTFLGFSEYDACKLMGLSAYGDPARCRRQLHELVTMLPNGTFAVRNDVLRLRDPDDELLASALGVRPRARHQEIAQEHQDLAAALQEITDEIIIHLARWLHQTTKSTNLCMAGGVALNCVTNTALMAQTDFEDLFVPSAAHDAGTALGAALLLSARRDVPRRYVMHDAYLGPAFEEHEAAAALEQHGLAYQRCSNVEEEVVRRLADGQIVGWFQGRMEFGPRALGNRSLLADPRRAEMRDVLNYKVKHREPFRPFAPSVLAEHASSWFQLDDSLKPAEFMLLAVPAQPSVQAQIPAVVHVDGSSRVQLVRRETNHRYHALLEAFYRLTGVPVVLNTSFNDDEPIVCSPADAIATFLKTRIDCLVLGDLLVERPVGLEPDRGPGASG